jgi:hypothetical protein
MTFPTVIMYRLLLRYPGAVIETVQPVPRGSSSRNIFSHRLVFILALGESVLDHVAD